MSAGRRLHVLGNYLLAGALVLSATLFTYWLGAETVGIAPQFFVAVMMAAWFGGLGPGVFATSLAAVVTAFYPAEPANSLAIFSDDVVRILGFLSAAVLISHLNSDTRRAQTQLKKAQQEAIEANRAKDRFLAVLSHELRNPLNPALLAVSAMLRDRDLDPARRQDLEMVRRNLEMEARLVDDLLDVSRIARGKLTLQPRDVDVHEVVHDALAICRTDELRNSVQTVLHLDAAEHYSNADPARLRQVFWNLLKNAVKFTPSGGTITVTSDNPQPGRLRVRVADTGIGIEPNDLARIFEAFEQGGESITHQFGGLGLGLAISKSLVQAHRGSIYAQSPGRGQGATFTVELPGIPAPVDSTVNDSDENPISLHEQHRRRILLVEDDRDSARILARLLSAEGHEVSEAPDYASAIQLSRTRSFDLIISDLELPDGSGLDLIAQLKVEHRIKSIALSGHASPEDCQRSREAGFDMHLAKPVDIQNLNRAIDQLLTPEAQPLSSSVAH